MAIGPNDLPLTRGRVVWGLDSCQVVWYNLRMTTNDYIISPIFVLHADGTRTRHVSYHTIVTIKGVRRRAVIARDDDHTYRVAVATPKGTKMTVRATGLTFVAARNFVASL